MPAYIPSKGDYIAVTFDPQSGHEQRGRRPAVVVSNNLFNKHTGLAIVCPITNTRGDFPFHVAVGMNWDANGIHHGGASEKSRSTFGSQERQDARKLPKRP